MHVPAPVPGKTDKHVISDAARTSANSHYDPGMLDRVIRIKQFCADDSYFFPQAASKHPLHPVISDHFNVIVHQKVIAAFCKFYTEII